MGNRGGSQVVSILWDTASSIEGLFGGTKDLANTEGMKEPRMVPKITSLTTFIDHQPSPGEIWLPAGLNTSNSRSPNPLVWDSSLRRYLLGDLVRDQSEVFRLEAQNPA